MQPYSMQGYSSLLSITFCFLQRCPAGPKALWQAGCCILGLPGPWARNGPSPPR